MFFSRTICKAVAIAQKLPRAPARLLTAVRDFGHLAQTVAILRYELDALKGSLQVNPALLEEFEKWKAETPIPEEPLVSVCIATYNRPDLLVNRCLHSILCADLREIGRLRCRRRLQLGDGRTAMAKIKDPRVRFHNLCRRGKYPANAMRRWMVAGTGAANEALRPRRGDYITHLDDDDEFLARSH